MEKTRKTLSSQITYYFVGKLIAQFVILLVPLFLVRHFSPTDYGILRQVLLVYIFFFRIIPFGLNKSLYYFISEDELNENIYFTNTFIFLFLAGTFTSLILYFFSLDISLFFQSPEIEQYLPLCGIYILLRILSSPFEILLVINNQAEIASRVTILTEVVRSIMLISMVYFFGTIYSAILGLLIFSLIRLLVFLIYIFIYSKPKIGKQNWTKFKSQLNYGVPIGFSSLIGTFYKRIDKFLVLTFYTPQSFAVYVIGCYHVPFLNLLFNSVGNVTLPRAVSLLKENQVNQFLVLWNQILVRLSFVGIGTFYLFQLVAEDFITLLFTEKYFESTLLFKISLFLILAHMLLYGIILRSLGNTSDIFKSNLIAFLISVPLSWYLISNFGLVGAATCSVILFYINAILQIYFTKIRLNRNLTDLFPLGTMGRLFMIAFLLFYSILHLDGELTLSISPIDEINKLFNIITNCLIFLPLYIYFCKISGTYDIFKESFVKVLISKVYRT